MENDKSIVRLRGKNVNLCVLRTDKEAVELYTKWINDETIGQWVHHNMTIMQFNDEVNWANKERGDNKQTFNIVDNKTGALVGNCEIGVYPCWKSGSLGILIGEDSHRNKGIGTEVIKMLIKCGFEQLGLHRIELYVVGDNYRAIKCYTKAGLKECGRKHEEVYYDNTYHDLALMEILRKDYENGTETE